MIYVLFLLSGLFVWTVASIIWLIASLGRKNQKSKWFDYILSPPVLLIATILWYRK